jgi:hypothetical protein
VFVLYDRKGSGEEGEGVGGAFGRVGAVGMSTALRPGPGLGDARQTVVGRRDCDLDVTSIRGHCSIADRRRTPVD